MKLVLAMLLLFCATGMLIDRVTRWTYLALAASIAGILFLTRMTF